MNVLHACTGPRPIQYIDSLWAFRSSSEVLGEGGSTPSSSLLMTEDSEVGWRRLWVAMRVGCIELLNRILMSLKETLSALTVLGETPQHSISQRCRVEGEVRRKASRIQPKKDSPDSPASRTSCCARFIIKLRRRHSLVHSLSYSWII